jgi:hypothetical protein
LRNLAIILAVAILATYAFIAVNERQKEHVIRLRLPKFRKINKYEFDKALYQVRESRLQRLKESARPRPGSQPNPVSDAREEFYKDYEHLESLKNSPSTEAQPIQEPAAEFPEQQGLQEDEQLQQQEAQSMTQELIPGAQIPEQQLQEDGTPLQQPKLRPLQRYQQQ